MKFKQIHLVKGVGGFFFDDQEAVKMGPGRDGFSYKGTPVLPGFKSVRMPGEAISVMMELDDGQLACGDCCAVQYSGAGGRDPLFLADTYIPWIQKHLVPVLMEMDPASFKSNAETIDAMTDEDGRPIHTAIRYGVTLALLDAAALSRHETMTQTVASEYGLDLVLEPVKVFGQSGDDRYINADKMIIKQADVMPHGLINNVEEKLGRQGEKLVDFIEWLAGRVKTLRTDESYQPEFHFDVYGTPGLAFNNDMPRVAEYLASLEARAAPFKIRIEGPVDMGDRAGQVQALKELREILDRNGSGVGIVADEWCNTREDIELFAKEKAGHMLQIKTPDLGGINNSIEAVLGCRGKDVIAYQGGTCSETDHSARICTQVALATRPYQILAKPGMGFDEGFMIVKNEMQRTLAVLKYRRGA